MPTYRDCILLDVEKLEDCQITMNASQVGMAFRDLQAAYKSKDFQHIRSLPFVVQVYPESSHFYRRHIPERVRLEVLASGPCVKCGTRERLTVDHVQPVSKGGTDERHNLQPMCLTCNIRKFNRT